MCGFFGILGVKPNELNMPEINDLLRHRGPNGSGVYTGDAIALATRHGDCSRSASSRRR